MMTSEYKLPSGEYLIGDPVHLVSQEYYYSETGAAGNNLGRNSAVFDIRSDGLYDDNLGNVYAVDTGRIGIIPASETPCVAETFYHPGYGTLTKAALVHFPEDFTIGLTDSQIVIGHVEIRLSAS